MAKIQNNATASALGYYHDAGRATYYPSYWYRPFVVPPKPGTQLHDHARFVIIKVRGTGEA